jgi:hypothetical protein
MPFFLDVLTGPRGEAIYQVLYPTVCRIAVLLLEKGVELFSVYKPAVLLLGKGVE